MKIFYKKYGIGIITLLLLCWIIFTPYPFREGGLEKNIYYFGIVVFVFFIAVLVTLLFDNFNGPERIILAIIFSLISLFIVTNFTHLFIENLFPGDYTKFFWEPKDRILINLIFYGLTLTFIILFCSLYNLIKKRNAGKITPVDN